MPDFSPATTMRMRPYPNTVPVENEAFEERLSLLAASLRKV